MANGKCYMTVRANWSNVTHVKLK